MLQKETRPTADEVIEHYRNMPEYQETLRQHETYQVCGARARYSDDEMIEILNSSETLLDASEKSGLSQIHLYQMSRKLQAVDYEIKKLKFVTNGEKQNG
ncbi:MAG: hypothetical protein DRQ46_00025 [Gammaproteobacteria bacterium]|nr:MAG: hypothetical protein DRQ46_00025 [Gammaproteobacteria bacterium]